MLSLIHILLGKVVSMPEFREYGQSFDMSDLNTRSVDAVSYTHLDVYKRQVVPQLRIELPLRTDKILCIS